MRPRIRWRVGWLIASAAACLGLGLLAYSLVGTVGTSPAVQALPWNVALTSLTCSSAGNCTAGGYIARHGREQVVALADVNGAWSKPHPIAGMTNTTSYFADPVVSCTSSGNCVAATTSLSAAQAVAASEVNGVWGQARPVPGLQAITHGGPTVIDGLSCGAAGWCALAGRFRPPGPLASQQGIRPGVNPGVRPFVATAFLGRWRPAQQIPGLASISPKGWGGWIRALSCGVRGGCAAVGIAGHPSDRTHLMPFTVSSDRGTWGRAQSLPVYAQAISCWSPGNCAAAGSPVGVQPAGGVQPEYVSGNPLAVVTERYGTWGLARDVPAPAVPANLPDLFDLGPVVTGLTCASADRCDAAFYYGSDYNDDTEQVPYFAAIADGRPTAARLVMGIAYGTIAVPSAGISSLSCGAPGDCTATGAYGNGAFHSDSPGTTFLITEADGIWGRPVAFPGQAAPGLYLVSCASSTWCAALGATWVDGRQHLIALTWR